MHTCSWHCRSDVAVVTKWTIAVEDAYGGPYQISVYTSPELIRQYTRPMIVIRGWMINGASCAVAFDSDDIRRCEACSEIFITTSRSATTETYRLSTVTDALWATIHAAVAEYKARYK